MNAVIRLLSEEMHPTQMVLLRNIGSCLLVIVWTAALQRGRPRFTTKRLSGHFWRASFGIGAMELWFYSVTIMPLTIATALSFTTPIFSTIFAILFLREKAGPRRWAAIATGIIGMLIILRPDLTLQAGAEYVLMSSAMMAVAGILVKTLTRTEPPETIVFYMSLFMIPWSLLPAMLYWQPLTPYQLWLVFLVAFLSTAAHLLLTRAFMRAEMVMLMPLDFTRLIFTALFAYLIFGETMNGHTITGSLVIVASTVYIAHREARKPKPSVDIKPRPV